MQRLHLVSILQSELTASGSKGSSRELAQVFKSIITQGEIILSYY